MYEQIAHLSVLGLMLVRMSGTSPAQHDPARSATVRSGPAHGPEPFGTTGPFTCVIPLQIVIKWLVFTSWWVAVHTDEKTD